MQEIAELMEGRASNMYIMCWVFRLTWIESFYPADNGGLRVDLNRIHWSPLNIILGLVCFWKLEDVISAWDLMTRYGMHARPESPDMVCLTGRMTRLDFRADDLWLWLVSIFVREQNCHTANWKAGSDQQQHLATGACRWSWLEDWRQQWTRMLMVEWTDLRLFDSSVQREILKRRPNLRRRDQWASFSFISILCNKLVCG